MVTGELADLIYGFYSIPKQWISQLAKLDDIENLTERLEQAIFSFYSTYVKFFFVRFGSLKTSIQINDIFKLITRNNTIYFLAIVAKKSAHNSK